MEKKIRLGIVGCGRMMKNHMKGVQLVDNVEVTAFCDVIRENAEYLAENVEGLTGTPYITTDWKTMVDHVDAILCALPHDLHYECGVFFARNKKHILMEKPLCNTEEECLKLIEICEEENVKLMCGYPLRYREDLIKLKELMDSGEFGKIMQVSVWTEQLTMINNEISWASTARLGGGQFFSHGCHYVDLLLWYLGKPISGMHFGTTVGTDILREGTSIAGFKFENGALAYHGATWGARGTRQGWDIQIMTEKGLLDYDRSEGNIKFYNQNAEHIPGVTEKNEYTVIWEQKDKENLKQTHYEIEHFADCVLNDKTPLTDGKSALKSLQIIWKMYDAEKFGVIADLRGMGFED